MRVVRDDERIKNSLFIDLRTPSKDVLSALSARLKTPILDETDILKNITPDFAIRLGKIGIIVINKNGDSIKVLQDLRYDRDPTFRRQVNEFGWSPDWVRKVTRRKNKEINLTDIVDDLTNKFKLTGKGFKESAMAVAKEAPIDVNSINRSVNRLKKDGSNKEMIERSASQGVRLGVLSKLRLELKGEICIMTETASKTPDPEHTFIEGIPMACEKLIDIYLTRPGCKHSFQVQKSSDIEKKLIGRSK